MPAPRPFQTDRLLSYSQQVLDQALALVVTHEAPGAPAFVGPVGAHLRHVIEHFQALLDGVPVAVVDYDARLRDRRLETVPAAARDRLLALRHNLGRWAPDTLVQPLQVLGQGGHLGDFRFTASSSVGRELAFVASHAVHHFALLATHLRQHGLELPAHFGRAPATVANDMAIRGAPCAPAAPLIASIHPINTFQEPPCLAPSVAA